MKPRGIDAQAVRTFRPTTTGNQDVQTLHVLYEAAIKENRDKNFTANLESHASTEAVSSSSW